ncbi:Frizzled/Smoothened family membrane region [Ancylostoma duodenale]|uniref:Frizzled/Smoothened family membrane region n=1 Tax=Ancylostoma duodenale TaxID=51022 RepID=A0A0C2FVS9_9BILA|nr:Frizzled/Smoothened family membrane region [Ancylostoma duodenale]
MAMCYLMISVVYMIGEDSFACGPYGGTPQLLVAQGGEGTACSGLAVAHYYFTIASSAWWVVLCLAWFLAANRKWGAESIAGLAPYFHAACWGIPALLSVVVLVTNSIDGDVFTGKRRFNRACSVMLISGNVIGMREVSGFAVMYVLPTAASAAVLCYQALQMPLWLDSKFVVALVSAAVISRSDSLRRDSPMSKSIFDNEDIRI